MRVDNGDGTWSYVGPSEPPPDRTIGPLTLRYDGQERFADAPVPNAGVVTWVEPEYVLTGIEHDPQTYLNFRAVDALGQRWVVAELDLEALEQLAPAEDAASWDSGATPGIEWNPDAGEEHLLQLTSSTTSYCAGNVAFVQNDQNGPLARSVNVPMDATERLTVKVGTWLAAEPVRCSGVLVRDDVVLTAAHCVTTSNGVPFLPVAMAVCTLENLDANAADGKVPACYNVDEVLVHDDWTGTNPYELHLDFALLFLERGTGLGAMPITTQSVVAGDADHHHGYPYRHPDCTPNAIVDDCLRADQRQSARELYTATGTVRGMAGAFGKWDTSFAPATSGGPHFLCANGDCGSPELTGVQATAVLSCGIPAGCLPDHAAGPKASAFRVGVQAMLKDHPAPRPCPAFGLEETDFAAHPPAPPKTFSPSAFSPTCEQVTPLPPNYETSICADTLVYLPPPGHPGGCDARDKLVVYLPGTGTAPAENDFPLQYAAYAGFRTLGLSYANEWDTSGWCRARSEMEFMVNSSTLVCHDSDDAPSSFDDFSDECPFWMRRERITGDDDPRSTYDITWANWSSASAEVQQEFEYLHEFPMEDSVLYRLLDTLIRLDQEDTADTCDWDSFYDTTGLGGQIEWWWNGDGELEITGVAGNMDVINWERSIVAGWSQGAGHAVWINLTEEVGGLFMLDGPSDMCLTIATDDKSGRGASYYEDLGGVNAPSGAAPRFGVYHVQSPAPDGAHEYDPVYHPDANRPVAWDNLFRDHGLPVGGLRMPSCDDESWDDMVRGAEPANTSGDPAGIPWLKRSPYPQISDFAAFTQIGLTTDQIGPCGPHDSMALSHRDGAVVDTPNCMSRTRGGPAASTPEAAHLFEAYTQGFCALGEP